MALIDLITRRQLPKGTISLGPVSIPLGATRLSLWVDRADLTDAAVGLSWSIMLSFDAGLSWRPWGGAGTIGGVVINAKTGLPEPRSDLTVALPSPENPNRQIEGVLVLSKAARLAVGLELT